MSRKNTSSLVMSLFFIATFISFTGCNNDDGATSVAPVTDEGTASGNSLYDVRDGKTYRTVTFGTQTWMAENMSYSITGSFCYNFDQVNCDLYGRLYTLSLVQDICPKGWRLPKYEDWETLREFFGGEKGQVDLNFTSSLAGYFRDGRFKGMSEQSMLYGGIRNEENYGEISALWMRVGRCVNDVSIENGDGFYVRCIKN